MHACPPMDTQRGTDAMPAAAAGAATGDAAESFVDWASKQRQRAARDGAWKVEVAERTVDGNIERKVTSWHDSGMRQHTPSRRAPQQGGVSADRPQQQSARSATDEQHPQRQTARQRRSALRSAAHHRSRRLRALRKLWLVVRCVVRLLHLSATSRALRAGSSQSKRRLSPSPDEQHDPLLRTMSSCSSDALVQPEGWRPWLRRRVLSRVGFGDG